MLQNRFLLKGLPLAGGNSAEVEVAGKPGRKIVRSRANVAVLFLVCLFRF